MVNLNDALNQIIKKGFWRDIRKLNNFIKFIEYGSQNFVAKVFNEKGRGIEIISLRMDNENERRFYEPIPYCKLPKSLKELEDKQLESLAQRQPKSIESDENSNPFSHPEIKGGPFNPASLKKY